MNRPSALLDLTIYRTDSRFRGVGRYVADLARGIDAVLGAAHGPDAPARARVLGLSQLDPWGNAQTTEDLGELLTEIEASESFAPQAGKWAYSIRFGLARAVRNANVDVVHLGCPAATPIGDCGCPRIVTCHDLIPHRFPGQYIRWSSGFRRGRMFLDHRRFAGADHVIAISETAANDVMSLLGVPASRVSIVYNGVDTSIWSPVAPGTEGNDRVVLERFGLGERPFVLYVGGGDYRKNIPGMFAALAETIARGEEVDLVWAGGVPTSVWTAATAEAARLGLLRHVRLIGWVSDADLAALYRQATAQLFVSLAEGFGYPVVEAMATGCPVVASDCSSIPEVAGDAALLIDPRNPEAIADALVMLVRDSGEAKRLSEAGLKQAARFTVEKMGECTLAVYEEVARTGGETT